MEMHTVTEVVELHTGKEVRAMQIETENGTPTSTVRVPASPNGGPSELPRAVQRLRSLSCETQSGRRRFTRQYLSRVERFRRRLPPRGR
jgi:hypothetical protein